MNKIYIVTGANGHLGNTIIRMLKNLGETVRGLILPCDHIEDEKNIQYIKGDVRDKASMEPLFKCTNNKEVVVIHTAGIIDISEEVSNIMYDVNVNGTKNIIELCLKYKVNRLVYVSSVHAIPELNKMKVLKEVKKFSPDEVVGGYAKTKAEATQVVLDSVEKGLNAVIVHPSGILGPYDTSGNHLVQMIKDYVMGKLPACVRGGYDFVDVRDVAKGCLAAVERGKIGECYILSNRHYEIKDVLNMIKHMDGGRKLLVLPIWIAKAIVPFMEWYAKSKKKRPLYTKYSLYTLTSNDNFSHHKATSELGYNPRDLYETISDTVTWINNSMNKKILS